MGTLGGKLGCAAAAAIVMAVAYPLGFFFMGDGSSEEAERALNYTVLWLGLCIVAFAAVVGFCLRWAINQLASPENEISASTNLIGCGGTLIIVVIAISIGYRLLFSF